MIARLTSRCPACGKTINAGTVIVKGPRGYQHEDCGQPVAPAAPKAPFFPSRLQQDIYDAIARDTRNIFVRARAGTGKTTTLEHSIESITQWAQSLGWLLKNLHVGFLAFNKHIVEELEARMPGFDVCTMHSYGLRIIKAHYPHIKTDKEEEKLEEALDAYPELRITDDLDRDAREEIWNLRGAAKRLVGLAMNTMVDENDPDAIRAMVDTYSLDLLEEDALLIGILPGILRAMLNDTTRITFNEMAGWWILKNDLGMGVQQFDLLLVDESQDSSPTQILMLQRAIKEGGRAIFVGDDRQAIYGFRGSDDMAVERLIEIFGCIDLPLNETRRCPKAVVRLAQTIVPDFIALPDAPEGTVNEYEQDDAVKAVRPGDMVLCRVNADLIPFAFRVMARGIKVVVRGRDIGAGLAALARKLSGMTAKNPGGRITLVSALRPKLSEWHRKELEKLARRNAKEAQIEAINDKFDCLTALMNEVDTTRALLAKIDTLFSDTAVGVVLSSVHRAKGLEATHVWILSPDKLPMRRKNQSEREWKQELNLTYVAYTRTKDTLTFIIPPDAKRRKAVQAMLDTAISASQELAPEYEADQTE